MKNFLVSFIAFILLSGCAQHVSASNPLIDGLDKKYNQTLLIIIESCSNDAQWVEKIAKQRDAGVPRQAVFNWVINNAEKEIKNNKPVTTQDVLWQVSLVIWVYGNPKKSPDEIFETSNTYCVDDSVEFLDRVYEATKEYYESLQLEPMPVE